LKSSGGRQTFLRRALSGLGIGLAAAAALGLLVVAGAFETPELLVFDGLQRNFADPREAGDDILLLTIDQGSLEKVEKAMGHRYPWPRALFSLMLRFIRQGNPRAVVFDLFLEGTSPGSEEQDGTEMDADFAKAISELGRVILGVKMRPPDPTPRSPDALELLQRARLPMKTWPRLARFGRIDPLSRPLIGSGARFGFVNVTPEGDGVVRRATLLADVEGSLVPSLALAALLQHFGREEIRLKPGRLQIYGRDVPVGPDGRAWVRFYGPGGIEKGRGRTYPYMPIANVLFSAVQAEQGVEPILDPSVFRDKWIIIGSTSAALFDLKATPFSKSGTFPGMEVQATVLNNLLHGDFLRRIPRWAVLLMVFSVCLLVGFLGRVTNSIMWAGIAVASVAAGFAVLSMVAFGLGVMVDLVAVEVGVFVTFAAVTFSNFMIERRGKQYIRNIFQYYLDPSVVHRLLEAPERLRLGGESRQCSVLFSDIAGFTGIAEKLPPEKLVMMMNLYLGEMTEIIIRHGGFLDKYIGDAIMAVFGAPVELENHAEAASLAALDCHRRLAELSRDFEQRGLPPLQSRIGVNTGSMVVGNMGSETRMNYTAMGDAVNLASRLEGVNKEFRTATIIGPETKAALGEGLVTRELDFIRVKGKEKPVTIYELVGRSRDLDTESRNIIRRHHEGLRAYRSGEFEGARMIFSEILQKRTADGPAAVYLERCDACLSTPPPEDWDGVYIMTRK
jgi:adenylate cyclase